MKTVMDILEAIGVGGAAGLSPLVAVAAVVLFAAVHLGIDPKSTGVSFVAGAAAVAVAAVVLLQSFLMIATPGGTRVRIAADRPRLMPVHVVISLILGAVAGAIVFTAEGHSEVVGAVLGALPAALVAFSSAGLLKGVTARLTGQRDTAVAEAKPEEMEKAKATGEGSTRILALGVDLVTIATVAASLVAPPIGLALPILGILIIIGNRRRATKKHEGLRVLR